MAVWHLSRMPFGNTARRRLKGVDSSHGSGICPRKRVFSFLSKSFASRTNTRCPDNIMLHNYSISIDLLTLVIAIKS